MPSHHSNPNDHNDHDDHDDYDDDNDDNDSGIPIIRVIAPATLQEGYSFDVLVEEELFAVRVPKGGVKEGQEFDVPYSRDLQQVEEGERERELEERELELELDEDGYLEQEQEELGDGATKLKTTDTKSTTDDEQNEHGEEETIWYDEATGAPIGRWRSGLCSCFDVLTQSTFWMGCCCTPVLMAQLITRLGLTWNGGMGPPEETQLSFNRIVLSMMVTLGFWKIPLLGGLVLAIFYLVIVAYAGSRVRKFMRQKYKIPPSLPTKCGHRMDDGCCMLFCGCCSAIQMARHSHDDKEFPGHGCTTTGLSFDAPAIV